MESSEICPICTQCGMPNTCVILDDHYTLFQCDFMQADVKANAAGFTLLHASTRIGLHVIDIPDHWPLRKHLDAIVGANIEHMSFDRESEDKRTSFMAIWGPSWLAQALKNYNHQHGYAGLSLSQYLDMVKP